MNPLKLGDKVTFEIEGNPRPGPHGTGIITRIGASGELIVNTDAFMAPGTKMKNIQPIKDMAVKLVRF